MLSYYLLFDAELNLLKPKRPRPAHPATADMHAPWWFFDSCVADRMHEVATRIPVMRDVSAQLFTLVLDAAEGFAETVSYRSAYLAASDQTKMLMARAYQLHRWHQDNQFCSRCAAPYPPQLHEYEPVKLCQSCGFSVYPRISPCIITLIHDGDAMLLARAKKYDKPMFSTIAGFIEAGETPEQALHREVYEEVGVEVKNLSYEVSQSWPFPHSLMLGYFAEYAGGEITFHDGEIVEAHWYTKETLPQIPPHGTISRTLIDRFLARQTSR